MAGNRVGGMITALGILYGLSVLFFSLRLYVRIFVSKNWGLDDTLLCATLASFTVYAGVSSAGLSYGTGRHVQDIAKSNLPKALIWWLGELFYTLTTVLLRLSIAVFLLRICVKRSHKYLIYGTMVGVVVFSIFYFVLAIFQCHPVSYFWMQFAGASGTCIDHTIFPDATYAHSAVSATADFVLGLLPVFIIWELKMNLQTKISVGVILSMGVIAGLGTLIRIPYIRVLSLTDDFLYATVDVAIWSTVEPALGIIAAAACVLRPLFKNFYDLSTRYGTRRSQPTTYGRSRAGYGGGRSNAMQEGLELDKNTAGMNRVQNSITSADHMTSVSNHVSGQLRDKKAVRVLNKSISSSNSSQEELTRRGGRGGGIQVHKTVEVSTHRRVEDDERNSTNSGLPTA